MVNTVYYGSIRELRNNDLVLPLKCRDGISDERLPIKSLCLSHFKLNFRLFILTNMSNLLGKNLSGILSMYMSAPPM